MKLTLFYVIISMLNSFQNPNLYKYSNDVKEIKIQYIDFDTETPIRINCSTFNYFGNDIKLKTIQNEKSIEEITSFLENLNESKSKVGVDVRFKIKIEYNSGESKEICGNKVFIDIENKQYLMNKNFLEYLVKILK
ncbi:hypothetical protein [Flavobacterium sp. HJJ]|uniref:hypothetical protein n=1 Tax=Flavobacterium sp. HJJ TaxID=2783792 RepID=UPI00188D6F25|nr:hypothetical protein [Flavobacterium sp. HJJ]MBF4471124.1 hypothetical protein [Flavobacterium sp. HJJ]